MTKITKIRGGLYLVLDPSMNRNELFKKLNEVLEEEIAVVQIWDNFPPSVNKVELENEICDLCHSRNVPVFLNNNWHLKKSTRADGIHFDVIPENFSEIKDELKADCMFGVTCNNDLSVIKWAHENNLDYISFCSIFPSQTSNSCELVSFETIKKAREITSMPIFLAGGIQYQNIKELESLEFEGVAVVSGIMSSENPKQATREYLSELKRIKNENSDN
ncbi:thiamine phosphate synthase [Salegentibacter sp. F188]|uniref:Thiamine phosphate synthase n=1 Tax=Autumnicola patrickiae TaxID=3075591 RepID=A0ABU3E4W2_9FLAO|nr:thiamine phosphate synthase [Salegentibacter sp. F188]MDT0690977.1 thiamine phosphate synthase [Salegentibacter sp. F188]